MYIVEYVAHSNYQYSILPIGIKYRPPRATTAAVGPRAARRRARGTCIETATAAALEPGGLGGGGDVGVGEDTRETIQT